jgi:hypothetical protein
MVLRDYSDIKKEYGEKIELRGALLLEQYNVYIQSIGVDPKSVTMSMDLLFEVVLNYFADIYRIKEFHGIKKVNNEKIAAYTAFWLLRIKPIQVIQFKRGERERYLLINEYFAANTLIAFLYDRDLQIFNPAQLLKKWNNFYEHLIYTFNYRLLDARLLGLMVVSLLTEAPYRRK